MNALILLLSMFRADAKSNGLTLPETKIVFNVRNLDSENAFGIATYTDYGWLIEIDSATYYMDSQEVIKRVVYHELGHALLELREGKGIMNHKRILHDITDKELKQLFRWEPLQ